MAEPLHYQSNQCKIDKPWLNLRYHDSSKTSIKMPEELEKEMQEPPMDFNDANILNRITGSMIGMALGDALGAHVEFRPHQYLVANPVKDLVGGGTWGLRKGQFTDDTSMALCLANSLVTQSNFNLYDQLVRYKWWYRYGYMSSTGQCFDIGAATSQSLEEFERRQNRFAKKHDIPSEHMDYISDKGFIEKFDVYCSAEEVAGNGALMRLAPVPLFFYRSPNHAVEYSGRSGQITHGDTKAYDACRYYGALIVAALNGYTKDQMLDTQFYQTNKKWFGEKPLCTDIQLISEGSYRKKGGYKDGIRGKGYIVAALEAALWAFWSDNNSFEKGALAAVNLGDDTDTTAAIYGQLAGAYYGYNELPRHWLKHVYAKKFIVNLSHWIAYEGHIWYNLEGMSASILTSSFQHPTNDSSESQPNSNKHHVQNEAAAPVFNTPPCDEKSAATEKYPNKSILRSTVSETSYHPPANRESLNYPRTNVELIQQSQPNEMNTKPPSEKSDSTKYSSTNGTSTSSSIVSRHHEKPLPGSDQNGPVLRTNHVVTSTERPVSLSTRSKNQTPSISDNKDRYSPSNASAGVPNGSVPVKSASLGGHSSKNRSSIASSTIHASPSTKISKPNKVDRNDTGSNIGGSKGELKLLGSTQSVSSDNKQSSQSKASDTGVINGQSVKDNATNEKPPTKLNRTRQPGKPPHESKLPPEQQQNTASTVYEVNDKYSVKSQR